MPSSWAWFTSTARSTRARTAPRSCFSAASARGVSAARENEASMRRTRAAATARNRVRTVATCFARQRPSSAAARHLLPAGEGSKGKRENAKGKSEAARHLLPAGEGSKGKREKAKRKSEAARHLLPAGGGGLGGRGGGGGKRAGGGPHPPRPLGGAPPGAGWRGGRPFP